MKTLKKIFLAGLPGEEIRYLEENIKESDALKLIAAETPEEICRGALAEEFRGAADDGLLVSGSREALIKAAELGMAAISYPSALPDTQADLIAEGFEEADARFLVRVFERHHHIPWKILETERCMLRELELMDLDALFSLYAQPEMTDYMEGLYPYEKEMEYQKTYIETIYGFYGYGMWLVFNKASGELIGRAGIESRAESGGELELGYAIAPPYQRQGYAMEVCRAILDYARKELDFKEISCMIEEGNGVSAHLAEKLGFKYQMIQMMGGSRMLKYVLKL